MLIQPDIFWALDKFYKVGFGEHGERQILK